MLPNGFLITKKKTKESFERFEEQKNGEVAEINEKFRYKNRTVEDVHIDEKGDRSEGEGGDGKFGI